MAGTSRRSSRRVRTRAARLAIQAAGPGSSADVVFSWVIFFESWLISGGDRTQKRFRLLDESTAELHVISPAPTEPAAVPVSGKKSGKRKKGSGDDKSNG